MPFRNRSRSLLICLGVAVLILWNSPIWADTPPAEAPTTAAADSPGTSQPAATKPADETEKEKDKPIPLSFNNAPMQQVAEFLTKQLKKPVIVAKDVQETKVTLVNPQPLPLEHALYVLRTALQEQGVAIEQRDSTIHLIPIAEVISRHLRFVPPEVDLATIEPSNEIVRKVFNVKQYDVTKLCDVLKPLLRPYGHLIADPATNQLVIVATVEDLIFMERIIRQFDQPTVSGRELRVFHVQNVDIYEILPWLQDLIASYLGVDAKSITTMEAPRGAGSGPGRSSGRPGGPGEGPGGSGGPGGAAAKEAGPTAITIQAESRPVLLRPDPRTSSIMIWAAPDVLAQVEQWLKELDKPKPASTDLETVEVRFGDAEDIAGKLTVMINSMPDEALRNAVRVFAFPASRRLMIRGNEQNRAIVKNLLAEIDVDTSLLETTTFQIEYADAQEVADNIKELFQERQRSWWEDYYGGGRRQESPLDRVTVTTNVRRNTVTVRASPEKMTRIASQIKEWDKPLGNEAAPRVYILKYADPEKVRELLENMFTKKERSISWIDLWEGRSSSQASPVGRLFGQFRFEAYPDLGKLIVVSKNEENYAVIDDMIRQIDVPQEAGLPKVIQLKYADAEPLAEQINALLNAPGTPARLLRRQQPSTFTRQESVSPYASQNAQNQQQRQGDGQQGSDQGVIAFWWQHSPSSDIRNRQSSNLVGKIRVVPNVEQNLLLVTAPEDYAEGVRQLINDLDKPGYQVLIRAVIAEVTHEDATSLGFRFSTDPSAFVSADPLITDNALRGFFTYNFEDMFGRQNTVTLDVDVNNLINLLRRNTDIKIKSEPLLYVADNVEGEFFDGQDIPFINNSQTTDVGGIIQSFDYRPVGITLRVRPHITKEGRVALTVNITASSIIPGRTLFGGAIVDRRETNQRVVLEDGRTFLISGMLREEDREVIRRIPGVGDIPLLGELFKHREMAKVNTELLIFLTPHIIGPDSPRDKIESEPLERLRRHDMMPSEGLSDSSHDGVRANRGAAVAAGDQESEHARTQ